MGRYPRVSLEQWRAFVAVVDAGGYAQAAEALSKGQSTITYAVKKLEQTLDVRAFEIQGRRAVLTTAGQLLYRRAKHLLQEATRLESAAQSASAGWEAQIGISAEVVFPDWLLLECLQEFGQISPNTRIELIESVMKGTQEDLLEGRADLALTGNLPVGFLGDAVMRLRFVPVAHPAHPLHQLNRPLDVADLRRHRHLVVRESGRRRDTAASMEAEQQWTVSNMPTSIGAACRGFGFAWFPEHKIRSELADGSLKLLPMRSGAERFATLYLVIASPDTAGPGVRALARIIRERCASRE